MTINEKMRIALIATSLLLTFCAGTWGYAFYRILRYGEVTFYEPNMTILVAEFGLAVFLTLLGFSLVVLVVVSKKNLSPSSDNGVAVVSTLKGKQ